MNEEILEHLNSFDLYLHYPANQVIKTQNLSDTNAGIYPCYYLKEKNYLKVASSVSALIFDLGSFQPNPSFKPLFYLPFKMSFQQKIWLALLWRTNRQKHDAFYHQLKNKIKPFYITWQTIDKRIRKLRSFEQISTQKTIEDFRPSYSIKNVAEIVQKSTYYITQFIKQIESQYPSHQHIILTSGKDSQLIVLTPKINSQNWHIFSAEPNYPLVCKWLKDNELPFENLFYHNNQNEETDDDISNKIISGDLYAEPTNIRWLPTLKKIAQQFHNRCFFWAGTAADALYSNKLFLSSQNEYSFFDFHLQRVATWQGNYHQAFKNFVGCPILSPYHSKEIWENLFQHLDLEVFKNNPDMREEIGETLFQKKVYWLSENPSPLPYQYDVEINGYQTYWDYISKSLSNINE